jgi:uncharacterized membrane protein (DUF4010 family)
MVLQRSFMIRLKPGGAQGRCLALHIQWNPDLAADQPDRLFSGASIQQSDASPHAWLRRACCISLRLRLAQAPISVGAGWLRSHRRHLEPCKSTKEFATKNPAEMRAAFLFSLLFVFTRSLSQVAAAHLGKGGVYALRALAGITGIASFIMDMTQTLSSWITVKRTAEDIVTWASNRNVEKGCYGYEIADRKTGRQSIRLLTGVALLGLVPLIWLVG